MKKDELCAIMTITVEVDCGSLCVSLGLFLRDQQACLVCPEADDKERKIENLSRKVEVKTSSIIF